MDLRWRLPTLPSTIARVSRHVVLVSAVRSLAIGALNRISVLRAQQQKIDVAPSISLMDLRYAQMFVSHRGCFNDFLIVED